MTQHQQHHYELVLQLLYGIDDVFLFIWSMSHIGIHYECSMLSIIFTNKGITIKNVNHLHITHVYLMHINWCEYILEIAVKRFHCLILSMNTSLQIKVKEY